PEADFARYFGAVDPTAIFVKTADGVSASAARTAVEDAARPYPAAKVVAAAGYKQELTKAVDMVLMIFAGLLGLAIVIALFGIANTLTLSVVERTRESALLRALGLTRRQLRRMLSVEALVMAVIGAFTGVVLGVALAGPRRTRWGTTPCSPCPTCRWPGTSSWRGRPAWPRPCCPRGAPRGRPSWSP